MFDIKQINHDNWQPFTLDLDGCAVSIDKLLRLVPSRRIVAEAGWKTNQTLIAKLFFGRHARKNFLRELKGNQKLVTAMIPAAKIEAYGKDKIHHVYIILFEKLIASTDIAAIWCGNDKNAVRELLAKMRDNIARMHQHNMLFADIHADNFFLTTQSFYLLDSGSVISKSALSEVMCLKNMATLYGQLFAYHYDVIDDDFAAYCQQRAWPLTIDKKRKFYHYFHRYIHYRIAKLRRKLLRNSTGIYFEKNFFRLFACKRGQYSEFLKKFASQPERVLKKHNLTIIKAGNTCTVFHSRQFSLVIKRYNIKNWWRLLKRYFRKSRAKRSWINAHILELLGIATAKPIAILERRIGWCHIKSYFVAEYVEGVLLRDCDIDHIKQFDGVSKFLKLLECFARIGIVHGDMKAANFKLDHKQISVLDLDAMRLYSPNSALFKKKFTKDLNRFLYNWHDKPAIRQLFVDKFKQSKLAMFLS
ncbi:MAG: hypothetical protein AAGA27_00690 [Pseudomonadota bacterium]